MSRIISLSLKIQSEVEAALESTFDRTQLTNRNDTNGKSVYEICKDHLNTTSRKRPDWFEENDLTITSLINEKNQLHQNILNERASRKTTRAYKESCRKVQREIRRLNNLWWQNKAQELQDAADRHDMRAFYAGLKEVWGPSPRSGTNIKSRDGTVLQDSAAVMERWVDHFSSLLNMPGDIAETSLQRIKQEPMAEWMSSAPTIDATQKAIHAIKDHKAPGGDGIPAEILKHGGERITQELHNIISCAWKSKTIPQGWKDAQLVNIFKKGDKLDCRNYRRLSLLSIPGKVMARILLNRLTEHIEKFIPESQSGFRSGRSTMDMIFSLKQIQEKCVEQNRPLYATFIDFTKAFDTGLWKLLSKYGCPEHFVTLIQGFHLGMKAQIRANGTLSDKFEITNGVKQGCVLAPLESGLHL